jgi:hypothetical protein
VPFALLVFFSGITATKVVKNLQTIVTFIIIIFYLCKRLQQVELMGCIPKKPIAIYINRCNGLFLEKKYRWKKN